MGKTSAQSTVDSIITEARQAWGYDPQWQITWEWTDSGDGRQPSNSFCDCDHLTEKRVHIKIDARLKDNPDAIRRNIYHELGHPVVANVWRGASDWVYVLVKDSQMREIFEEQQNTRENEVIDWIVFQIFRVK